MLCVVRGSVCVVRCLFLLLVSLVLFLSCRCDVGVCGALFVIRCWLYVVPCLRLVVARWLVFRCSLFVVVCWWLCCCLLFVVCCV